MSLETSTVVEIASNPAWLLFAAGFVLFTIIQRDFYKDLALKDSMTKLFNKLQLKNIKIKEQAKLDKGDSKGITIINIDLNDFKPVNDTYGHQAGDAILIETGRKLKSLCRGYDTALRVGGDEFLMILKNITPDTAKVRVEKIRQELQNITATHPNNDKVKINVTASVGSAHVSSGQTIEDGMTRADADMYSRKPKNSRKANDSKTPTHILALG